MHVEESLTVCHVNVSTGLLLSLFFCASIVSFPGLDSCTGVKGLSSTYNNAEKVSIYPCSKCILTLKPKNFNDVIILGCKTLISLEIDWCLLITLGYLEVDAKIDCRKTIVIALWFWEYGVWGNAAIWWVSIELKVLCCQENILTIENRATAARI